MYVQFHPQIIEFIYCYAITLPYVIGLSLPYVISAKEFPIFAGSLLIIFLQGQKSLPSSLPASKDRAKMRFSHSTRGKDGHFRFGAYMYYIPPNRTPHFCHWPNRATRSLPGLCPIFAQRFQIFARFLLAEKLLDFQDFPVIAKQRCFNLIF